ncbi:MAG: DJ-1/PfpI family protein [Pseudomonadales bacterium]
MKIIMLAYPGMTPLDLLGPLQAWSMVPGFEIQIVWKNTDAVMTDTGLAMVPTHTFEESFESPDIIFAPGGTKATFDLMKDEETITFLRQRGEAATWVTSVCTGALLIGAAGLLNGYKATTHWAAIGFLKDFGAIHTEGRYVIDRNRATGGGVTAGIDFGLAMIAELVDEETARVVQLAMEYSPQPPYQSGTPGEASAQTVEAVISNFTSALS